MNDARFIQAISEYYTDTLRQHGATSRGVDWRDEVSHALRHRQFIRLFDGHSDFSICDLGCGYGHFLSFLRENGFAGRYIGCDIAPAMIEHARQIHGEGPGLEWRVGGLPDETCDYVVASGLFNVRLDVAQETWEGYIFDTLDAMYRACTKGFAFNILSSVSDPARRRENLYYADPDRFFWHCVNNFGRKVALLHDTELYEFTIIQRR